MKREETTLPNTEFTTATGNFDKTRKPIDRIVIHTTVGSLQSAINRFGTRGTNVSAHYIIDVDGKLYQGLEEYYTAYHSGNYEMNQRSIGIEHVDNGNYTAPRPDALYDTSSKLVADICTFYNIPCDRKHIIKHNEVAATGCPHNLDIDRIIRQAQAIIRPQQYYKGIDLNNLESVKVCIDTWYDAAVANLYIKKDEHQRILHEKEATIQNLNQRLIQIGKEHEACQIRLKEQSDKISSLHQELITLGDEFEKTRDDWQINEGNYINHIKALKEQTDKISSLHQELITLEDEFKKTRNSWQIKERNYIKHIKALKSKMEKYKSPIKRLFVEILERVFGAR